MSDSGEEQRDDELRGRVEDASMLRELAAELVDDLSLEEVCRRITDVAVRLGRAQYASMQSIEPDGRGGEHLRLLAFRGFNPRAARFWEIVTPNGKSTCSVCMTTGKRLVVTDVEQSDWLVGSDDLAVFRETGIRAVQTTPLMSASGKLLGMLSTHWSHSYTPTEWELQNFDLLAQHAGPLLERHLAEDLRLIELGERHREAQAAFERAAVAVNRRTQEGVAPTVKELQRQRDAWLALEAARRALEEARD